MANSAARSNAAISSDVAASVSATLIDKVVDWLMAQALEDTELEDLVQGCCERLAAAGVPLARANFSFSVLHPLYRAMGFTWRRGEALKVEGFRHLPEGESDRFLKSPYYYLINNGLEYMRQRLDTAGPLGFPLLEELRDSGLHDYLAFVSPFRKGSGQGMNGSWATDRPNGFLESDIAALLGIQTRLAVAARMAVQMRAAARSTSFKQTRIVRGLSDARLGSGRGRRRAATSLFRDCASIPQTGWG